VQERMQLHGVFFFIIFFIRNNGAGTYAVARGFLQQETLEPECYRVCL